MSEKVSNRFDIRRCGAVGDAAAQAIAAGMAVQDLPYAPLRRRLIADGQVLAWQKPL